MTRPGALYRLVVGAEGADCLPRMEIGGGTGLYPEENDVGISVETLLLRVT